MDAVWALPLLTLMLWLVEVIPTDPQLEILVNKPGHLKPFGFGHHQNVPEMNGFPFTKHFFTNNVKASRPLVMREAAKLSGAFSLWTDDYFLSLDEPADSSVVVEMKKKENRSEPSVHMSFKDFVGVYKTADQYMVNSVPTFLENDVMLPAPLQCPPMRDEVIVDTVMWFSSGGTKSVVHTDSLDNINCLYRGEKELIFVDPHKHGQNVDIDHPEGAYSGIDVDRVDFTKYPGMAEVDYYYVHMFPGDCLYIPYKWIHQVTSHAHDGSNIAVNVWWDHFLGLDVDLHQCPDHFDPAVTLADVQMVNTDHMSMTKGPLRDHLLDYTRRGALDLTALLHSIVGDDLDSLQEMDAGKGYQKPARKIMAILDQNTNQLITEKEVLAASDEDWENIIEYMTELDVILQTIQAKWDEVNSEPEDWEEDYEEEFLPKDEL